MFQISLKSFSQTSEVKMKAGIVLLGMETNRASSFVSNISLRTDATVI